jgi:hypothetical protein
MHFPLPRQRILALDTVRRNDFLPAVLGITKNRWAGCFKGIVAGPEFSFPVFNGPRRKLPYFVGQAAQNFTIAAVDPQVLAGQPSLDGNNIPGLIQGVIACRVLTIGGYRSHVSIHSNLSG